MSAGVMAEETIYLCNFRVSVDGDWLCLKELTDVNIDLRLTQIEDGQYPLRQMQRINLFLLGCVCPTTRPAARMFHNVWDGFIYMAIYDMVTFLAAWFSCCY